MGWDSVLKVGGGIVLGVIGCMAWLMWFFRNALGN